jgi:hypothetical protein
MGFYSRVFYQNDDKNGQIRTGLILLGNTRNGTMFKRGHEDMHIHWFMVVHTTNEGQHKVSTIDKGTYLEEHRGRPQADFLLLVEIIVLRGTMQVLDVATEGARGTRGTAEVLEAKDGLEDVRTDFENIVFSQQLDEPVTQEETLLLGTGEVDLGGVGIHIFLENKISNCHQE